MEFKKFIYVGAWIVLVVACISVVINFIFGINILINLDDLTEAEKTVEVAKGSMYLLYSGISIICGIVVPGIMFGIYCIIMNLEIQNGFIDKKAYFDEEGEPTYKNAKTTSDPNSCSTCKNATDNEKSCKIYDVKPFPFGAECDTYVEKKVE